MAVLKVPRIRKQDREAIVLQASEIVFDLDEERYWGGNGATLGGIPLSESVTSHTEYIKLTNFHIENKRVQLPEIPLNNNIILTPSGGIPQIMGVDFILNSNLIIWEGLGLDGFLEVDDYLIIQYAKK